ncbi:MAG: metalloregulator ArsR/SmtB family transcription factor [Blastomonas sp.]
MSALYTDREAAASAAEKLKVFAQPQRLMILSCLLDQERNVSEIADVTGIGQPALSQQLGELRRAELVSTRKESKLVWYSLADAGVALCVRNMEAIFGGNGDPAELIPADSKDRPHAPDKGVAGFAQIL